MNLLIAVPTIDSGLDMVEKVIYYQSDAIGVAEALVRSKNYTVIRVIPVDPTTAVFNWKE